VTGTDVTRLLPELMLAASAVAGLLLGSWLPRRRQAAVRWLGVAGALGGLVAAAAGWSAQPVVAFGTSHVVDTVTGVGRVVVLAATAVVLVLAGDPTSWGGHHRETEFAVLVQLAAVGTMLLTGANDLLLLAAAYLLASVPLYAVAGLRRDARGTEAALKYFLSGALLGLVLLLGVTLLLGLGRSTAYPVLAATLPAAPPIGVGVALVAVLGGLLFKMGGVPGHFWVPDATDGTPPATGAFLTTVGKVGGLLATWRLLVETMPTTVDWPLLVALLAAASMVLGTLGAFAQTSLRRLLAYSTVAQVGFLLVPIAVATRSALALPALLAYLGAYAVTNLVLFAALAARPHALEIADQRGLARERPGLAAAVMIGLLGLVGTPPSVVFVGKLAAFGAAVDGGMAWLAALAVAASIASLFYSLRWIAPVLTAGECPVGGVAPRARVIAGVLAVASVLGAAAGPLLG